MTVSTVTKSLATIEDLAQGVGTVDQARGGSTLSLHRIKAPVPFATVADMVADTTLVVGQYVSVESYFDDYNSGIILGQVVALGTGTVDGGSFINLPNALVPAQFKQNLPLNFLPSLFGVKFSNSPDDAPTNTVQLQAAWDYDKTLRLPTGTAYIDAPLTRDVNGMQVLGVGPGISTIKAVASYSGTYILDMGNDIGSSRSRCRVSNVGFSEVDNDTVTGIRWQAVNNTSSIDYCSFSQIAKGVDLSLLSLSNNITFNRFFSCPINIELGDSGGGNSTKITHNYFNSGQVYLNNSMTEVEITHNTFDSNATLFSDGASGPRALFINNNRFEVSNSSFVSIILGVCRGVKIHDNFFAGNGQETHAIEFTSSGAAQAGIDVHNNWYEGLTTNFVVSSLPNDALSVHGNNTTVGAELANPYSSNSLRTGFEGDIYTPQNVIANGFVAGGATAAQFADINSDINTINKSSRLQSFDTTNGKPVYATGSAAGAVWNNADGSVAYTPVP